RRALEIAIQVARGLAFAHEHGLVHRDVKPQNVILNGDGRAKVTDFGIARSLDVQGVTQTGTVLGTSNYIAPEQASGEPVDQTTDVYSLGVVLFELLTGEVPFPGESFVAVAMRHVSEPPPNVLDVRPEVPARVAHAVGRALQKDPAARFPTMDAFAAELQACLAALGPRPDADTTLVRQRPVLRESARRVARAGTRRRLLPLALVLVGLALLALVVAALLLRGGGGKAGKHGSPSVAGHAVRLFAGGSYDPQGDGAEHSAKAPLAVDGNPSTYWDTEHYRSFTKSGVGLVLDARRTVRLGRLHIDTSLPGFRAQIRGGSSAGGPFPTYLSAMKTIGQQTTIALRPEPVRYVLLWITALPTGQDQARINEVKAYGAGG
ncbi:MAG: serine/threonine protein kinase, partial [Actinobacteria bacterium]